MAEFDRVSQRQLLPTDPAWEAIDPTPDVRALFLEFDEQFFNGRLAGIEVKWSPRMVRCGSVLLWLPVS